MFNQQVKRIGFACKIQDETNTPVKELNTKTTTISWLRNQTRDKAVERLYSIAKHNLAAVLAQVQWVGAQAPHLRMFRLSSDILPAYSYEDWTWFYFEPDVVKLLESELAKVGEAARALDVRLSFHPGQFCVLASDNPNVVEASVHEFEYHCDLIRYMGFGREFQDFKCNVHIGGKQGPEGIRKALRMLSKEARNTLTIENAEFSWGLDASLELADSCALVLDIHHHNIFANEYISPDDTRIQKIKDSWRGVRPVIHYSMSREEHLAGVCASNQKPDIQQLVAKGLTKAKLRTHSDTYWNDACNRWALDHLAWADIMCESKSKNLASFALAESTP